MNKNNDYDYNQISPTAKITGYWKSLSDIPFSKEIAEAVNAEQTAKKMQGDTFSIRDKLGPVMLEARYKVINEGLRRIKVANVLELACGLSPRGLELASNNIKYVGTDLPEIHSECFPVINKIMLRCGISDKNLHYQAADVLNRSDLENAIKYFNGEKTGICNEGLLMYLNKKEKETMAYNIKDILIRNGGYWVTTDILFTNIREQLFNLIKPESKKKLEIHMENISGQIGRDFPGNEFKGEIEAKEFYENIGFKIETFPFYNNNYKYKLSTLSLVPEEMEEPVLNILSKSMCWILTPIIN